MSNNRCALIGTVGIPPIYGGFETLAEYLALFLNNELLLTVYCSRKRYNERPKERHGVKLKYIPIDANGISSVFYDAVSILDASNKNDVLLLLGVSGAWILPVIKMFKRRIRIVTNIDGIEWKREKWSGISTKILKKLEEIAITQSDKIIVDNEGIAEYVRNNYRKDVTLIEYGADHVSYESISSELLGRFPFLSESYYCSIARIEPENKVHIILESFKKNQRNLVFIGNWNANDYARKLYNDYNKLSNIHLIGPIYDLVDLNAIRSNCVVYIHGHSAGGTNPSLVEAMYLGRSIIAYDVVYNRYTTENCASYFDSSEHLIEELNSHIDNGKAMKEISTKRYTWNRMVKKYYSILKKD